MVLMNRFKDTSSSATFCANEIPQGVEAAWHSLVLEGYHIVHKVVITELCLGKDNTLGEVT